MRRKGFLIAAAVLALAAGLVGYWRYAALYPSTRDAYVQAHIVTVAAQLTGKITSVHVAENQRVSAGDPLFDLDDTTHRHTVAQARAEADAASDAIAAGQQAVEAARARQAAAASAQSSVDAKLSRTEALFKQGNAAQASLDDARTNAAKAQADLDAARSGLATAQAQLKTRRDTLAAAQARLANAETDLTRTHVTAPVDGWVTNLALRPGSAVTAYAPLFALVDPSEWWVEANFRETDLPRIKPGQRVTVTVDMLPGRKFTGHIGSLAHGSGSTFALLPAENASGNWVKVTQRFAVRIPLDQAGGAGLRVGASAMARVDTTAAGRGQ